MGEGTPVMLEAKRKMKSTHTKAYQRPANLASAINGDRHPIFPSKHLLNHGKFQSEK
jgi:hypothetical protein